MTKLLLEKGWDPNAVDLRGLTPLMCAADQDHRESATLLLAAGANVNARGE